MGISTTKVYTGHVVMSLDDLGSLASSAKAEALKPGDTVTLTIKVTGVNESSRMFKGTLDAADVLSDKSKARHETAAPAPAPAPAPARGKEKA